MFASVPASSRRHRSWYALALGGRSSLAVSPHTEAAGGPLLGRNPGASQWRIRSCSRRPRKPTTRSPSVDTFHRLGNSSYPGHQFADPLGAGVRGHGGRDARHARHHGRDHDDSNPNRHQMTRKDLRDWKGRFQRQVRPCCPAASARAGAGADAVPTQHPTHPAFERCHLLDRGSGLFLLARRSRHSIDESLPQSLVCSWWSLLDSPASDRVAPRLENGHWSKQHRSRPPLATSVR